MQALQQKENYLFECNWTRDIKENPKAYDEHAQSEERPRAVSDGNLAVSESGKVTVLLKTFMGFLRLQEEAPINLRTPKSP